MAAKVPAWRVAKVGKNGVGANLVFGRIYVKLNFAVFLFYGVGGLHSHGSHGLAAGGNPEANGEIVSGVKNAERED